MTSGRSVETDLVAVFKSRDETRDQLPKMEREVEGVNRGFGTMAKIMSTVGLSSLSMGFALKAGVESFNETQQIAASAALTIGAFGEDTAANFADMERIFGDVGNEFAFTTNEVAKAFNILVRESEGMVIATDDVRFALALARAEEISVAEASRIVALFKRGETQAWEDLIGPVRGYTTDLLATIEAGKESITATDRLKFVTALLGEGIGDIIGFLTGQKDATRDLSDAEKENIDFLGNTQAELELLKSIYGDFESNLGDATFAVADNSEALRDLIDRLFGTGEEADETADKFTSFADQASEAFGDVSDDVWVVDFEDNLISAESAMASWVTDTDTNLGEVEDRFVTFSDRAAQAFGDFEASLGLMQAGFDSATGLISGTSIPVPAPPVSGFISEENADVGVIGRTNEAILSSFPNVTSAGDVAGLIDAGAIDLTTAAALQIALAGGSQSDLIPQLKHGGITTGETLAMIGEGGQQEAIIPLDRLAGITEDLIPEASADSVPVGSGDTIIQIFGDVLDESTVRSLGRTLERTLTDANRKGLGVRGQSGVGSNF